MPIKQFLYFDAIECLPENVYQSVSMIVNPNDQFLSKYFVSEVSRYYSQEIIFGENFQHQLGQLKYFMV
jgi:hypothetical protein